MRRDRIVGGPAKSVGLSLPITLHQLMADLATENRRTLSAEVQLALEDYLGKQGLWPVGKEVAAAKQPPRKRPSKKEEVKLDESER